MYRHSFRLICCAAPQHHSPHQTRWCRLYKDISRLQQRNFFSNRKEDESSNTDYHLERLRKKIEEDPYEAIFGASNRWLGMKQNPVIVRTKDTQNKQEHYNGRIIDVTAHQSTIVVQGSVKDESGLRDRSSRSEYDIDPITLRKIPRPTEEHSCSRAGSATENNTSRSSVISHKLTASTVSRDPEARLTTKRGADAATTAAASFVDETTSAPELGTEPLISTASRKPESSQRLHNSSRVSSHAKQVGPLPVRSSQWTNLRPTRAPQHTTVQSPPIDIKQKAAQTERLERSFASRPAELDQQLADEIAHKTRPSDTQLGHTHSDTSNKCQEADRSNMKTSPDVQRRNHDQALPAEARDTSCSAAPGAKDSTLPDKLEMSPETVTSQSTTPEGRAQDFHTSSQSPQGGTLSRTPSFSPHTATGSIVHERPETIVYTADSVDRKVADRLSELLLILNRCQTALGHVPQNSGAREAWTKANAAIAQSIDELGKAYAQIEKAREKAGRYYSVLAFDSMAGKIRTGKIREVQEEEERIEVLAALQRVKTPGMFLEPMMELVNKGYEVVSCSPDMIVLGIGEGKRKSSRQADEREKLANSVRQEAEADIGKDDTSGADTKRSWGGALLRMGVGGVGVVLGYWLGHAGFLVLLPPAQCGISHIGRMSKRAFIVRLDEGRLAGCRALGVTLEVQRYKSLKRQTRNEGC